jgi:hypothetical protein
LKRGCTITEKIDGTNAQITISNVHEEAPNGAPLWTAQVGDNFLYAGSRTRIITPGKLTDNFGFAQWVKDNANQLVRLGPGRHYGEWYGKGIQRGYGLDVRRFALFNSARWTTDEPSPLQEFDGRCQAPACCDVVPVLYQGPFTTDIVDRCMLDLATDGSTAVHGFKNPEGVVVYHDASRTSFKVTMDDRHKEAA